MNLLKIDLNKTKGMHPTAARWIHALLLTLVFFVAWELISPLVWRLFSDVETPYTSASKELVAWLFTLLLFYLLAEPVRFRLLRRQQWRGFWLYPPLWFAVPLSLVLLGAREMWLPAGLAAYSSNSPSLIPREWVAAAAALVAVLLRQLPRALRRKSSMASQAENTSSEHSGSKDQGSPDGIEEWISSGERPLQSDEEDLFGHRRLSTRITRVIGEEKRSVALLGEFGTGKSSILNLVRAELGSVSFTVIVARIDVWTIPNAEDAPSNALKSIIHALDDYVDTTDLRGLPRSYKRLAAAEPSGRLARFFGGDWSKDSVQAIERLSPILEALDAQIVLMVEDLERTGEKFDNRHLERFLLRLKGLERASVVVAINPVHATFDFAKVCDTIERVPLICADDVARIVNLAYNSWRTKYDHIDPHPDRAKGDKLELSRYVVPERGILLRQLAIDTPVNALVSLLQTPRSLKHVLSTVDRVWRHLHGEAELDDIVIISAIRHGAPSAFGFLLANMDAARLEPDELKPLTTRVGEEWENITSGMAVGSAVKRLVGLWDIEQLAPDNHGLTASLQGVEFDTAPVDYFSRILAEELAPGEIPDQTVVRDIKAWDEMRDDALINRLLKSTIDGDQYSAIWAHFSSTHSIEDLKQLTVELMARLVPNEGPSLHDASTLLETLHSKCWKRIHPTQYRSFINELLKETVPRNLSLTNVLLARWPDTTLIRTLENHQEVMRRSVDKIVRSHLKTPSELVRVLDRRDPHAVRFFVTTENSSNPIENWGRRVAGLTLLGAETHPDVMIPQLAGMADSGKKPYRIRRNLMKLLFEDTLENALGLLAGYEGGDEYILKAKKEASAWLAELHP